MTEGKRKVRLEERFPWEIATAMAEAPLCYLPLGTLEWHGEHAAVGLDALKAHAVCIRAVDRSGGIVVPPLYWSTDWREDLPDGSYLTGGIERGGPLPRARQHVLAPPRNLPQPAARHLRGDAASRVSGNSRLERPLVDPHNIAATRETGEVFRREHPKTGWLLLTDQEVVPDLHYPVEHAAGARLLSFWRYIQTWWLSTRCSRPTARCSPTMPGSQHIYSDAGKHHANTSASIPRLRAPRTIPKGQRSSAAGSCSRPSSNV